MCHVEASIPHQGGSRSCVVLTARIVKQKSSELGTFAARPTVTVGASSVRQDLGPKKGQSVGKAWIANGLVRPRIEEGGAIIGRRPFEEIARWSPVEWISN